MSCSEQRERPFSTTSGPPWENPLHVRGLDADADPSDLSVVRADGAPVLVSAQNPRSEAGIAPGAPGVRLDGSFGDADVQTDLRQDVRMVIIE